MDAMNVIDIADEVTTSAQLTVLPSETPLFTKRLEEIEVVEGRPARFDCKISGNPAPTVNWYHFGRTVQDSERMRVLQDRGLHSLIIGRVCSEDEGEYLVVARNDLGEVRCSAELYVEEPRATLASPMTKLEKMPSIPEEPEGPDPETEALILPDFIQTIRDVEVLEGGQAKLQCQVCGSPRPTVTWCHHGLRLEPGGNITMTQQKDTFCLIIKLAKRSDGGVYKCVISNKAGKSSAYAHVYIIDQPLDPPENVHVQNATSRTITLSWKEPKKIHSFIDPSSVTYAVQNQVRGVNNWSDLATGLVVITYTVQNLIPGLEYSFRVITSSGNFCSKPSKPTTLFCLPQKDSAQQRPPTAIHGSMHSTEWRSS
uniref:striated muscle preferentially expressed protein kinase-like n=1 Tax=Myxine glutinosa TaxID=7769 RepID=UPI00358FAC3B